MSLTNTTGDVEWRADAAVTFRPEQLAAFHSQLTALLDDLNGEATLQDRWNALELHLRLEAGKGEISGRIEELGLARMEFDHVRTDQSYLADAVPGIREIVERFPPRM